MSWPLAMLSRLDCGRYLVANGREALAIARADLICRRRFEQIDWPKSARRPSTRRKIYCTNYVYQSSVPTCSPTISTISTADHLIPCSLLLATLILFNKTLLGDESKRYDEVDNAKPSLYKYVAQTWRL